MRVKKLLTPGEFWQTVQYLAYGNYLRRERKFREGHPGAREWEGYRQKVHLFMLSDWFLAVEEAHRHYSVVPVNPDRIAERAYHLWEDRRREGVHGTPECDWLNAEQQLALEYIHYPSREFGQAA